MQTNDARSVELSMLTLDGVAIEDLCLTFVLPGYPSVELKPTGGNVAVTLETLAEYVQVSKDIHGRCMHISRISVLVLLTIPCSIPHGLCNRLNLVLWFQK